MHGVSHVRNAYNTPKWLRRLQMSFLGPIFCKKDHERQKKLHFFKKYLEIDEAVEPDNIKWQNLASSSHYRSTMTCVVWLIAIALITLSLIGIVIFKVKSDNLKKEFNNEIICPVSILDMKFEAYQDYILEDKEK